MRIGFFGGSFDPPHRGHLAVAQAAAETFALDTILFVPTGQQPLKPSGPVASYADRLAMVTLLCNSVGGESASDFQPSRLEAPLPASAPNYTVDTLTRLKTTLTTHDKLFVLLGADAFLQLPKWRSPEQLLALADWIIVSRPGFDLTRLHRLSFTAEQRRRIHMLPTLSNTTSATGLRQEIASDPPSATLLASLPATVLSYILDHHLYRP